MRVVSVEKLRPGMILGRALFNENGSPLLQRGVVLNERYINAIRNRRFIAVYITDGTIDEVPPRDLVSDRVRNLARKHVVDLFELVKARGAQEVGNNQESTPLADPAKNKFIAATFPVVQDLCQEIEKIVNEILMTAEAIDGLVSLKSFDNFTFEHSLEVTVVAVTLGRRLYLTQDYLRQLALGSILHDIGKLMVPVDILNKPDKLTPEEMAVVMRHPQSGFDLLHQTMRSNNIMAQHVVLQHHERQDGNGYPRHLRGFNNLPRHQILRYEPNRILQIAEIAAVADVYSALASDRPYRPALTHGQIVKTMQEMSGSHLNSAVVKAFLSILPAHQVGILVEICSGELRGYRGSVAELNRTNLDRPIIRLVRNANNEPITPIEIDTSKDLSLEFVACESEDALATLAT